MKVLSKAGILLSWGFAFLGVSADANSEMARTEWPATAVIWDVARNTIVSAEDLKAAVAQKDQVVLGETHYSEEVQNAEAWIFNAFADERATTPTLAWEFLNWSERAKVQSAYSDWSENRLTDEEFLTAIFGSAKNEATYLPLLRAARDRQAPLLTTNLTRAEKRPVSQGGIGALDPTLLPQGFELGGAEYFDRFKEAMGGHGTPQQLENYFAAQCLTDDVIADHLVRDLSTQASVLVVGSFHTAYFDGTWRRLEVRDPDKTRLLIHLEKTETPLTEAEQRAFLRDARYGPIADYVVFF